jgi:hypothetical protein
VKHVVQFSTGAGSAEVAYRVATMHGVVDLVLLTADTRVEDEDNWRFAREVVADLGISPWQWIMVADGRTPMQVGRDHRVVPNNRMAVCSRVLKRELLRRWIDEHCNPYETTIYLGYDWTEPERYEAAKPLWAPYAIACPLMEKPYTDKPDLLDKFRTHRGIEPPRLYAQGFHHANCGGACVRGGQAQWQLLLRVNRPLYLEWETEEEITRDQLSKDVSILRDRTKGELTPLTLRAFRERIDMQPSLFDADDWGACGCTDTFGGREAS